METKSSKRTEECVVLQDSINYFTTTELVNEKIIITFFTELAPYKWTASYTFDELKSINQLFVIFQNITVSFDYIFGLLKNNRVLVKKQDSSLELCFEENAFSMKLSFSFTLSQEPISKKDSITQLCNIALEGKKKQADLEKILEDQQNTISELQNTILKQDEIEKNLQNEQKNVAELKKTILENEKKQTELEKALENEKNKTTLLEKTIQD